MALFIVSGNENDLKVVGVKLLQQVKARTVGHFYIQENDFRLVLGSSDYLPPHFHWLQQLLFRDDALQQPASANRFLVIHHRR